MAGPLIYGDGSLYDDGDEYGRIGAALANAQALPARETGLKVSIINEQLNAWEHWAGTHSQPELGLGWGLYYPANDGVKIPQLAYYSYRGHGDMAVKANGDIIMIRVGDPADVDDRQLWRNVVSDHTDPSDWTSGWSVLYSGNHYGKPSIRIASNGTTELVYHCKSDGLYRNNSQVVDNSTDFETSSAKAIWYTPISGTDDMGFIHAIVEDEYGHNRRLEMYFIEDVTSDAPFYMEALNYDWKLGELAGYFDGTIVHGIFSNPLHYSPRNVYNGAELAYFQFELDSYISSPFYPIRGVGGGAGVNYLSGVRLHQSGDGYWYIFTNEIHQKAVGDPSSTSTLGSGFPVWMRSKDLKHWTDPIIGPPIAKGWGNVSPVEVDGFIYFGDHEEMWRRPVATVVHDITNYVPELEFELPRDNQPATGSVKVANPGGVNDIIKTLSGREIVIEPGLKLEDGTYEFTKFDRFFIEQNAQSIKGAADRLEIAISNVWGRLNNPYRDVNNFIGKFNWDDFSAGKRNQPFNYFFASDSSPSVDDQFRLHSSGLVLLTAWKGHNPDITVKFNASTGNPGIIFKYINPTNYWKLELASTTLRIVQVLNGTSTTINSWAVSADTTPKLRIRLEFSAYYIWLNDAQIIGSYFGPPMGHNAREVGYVGFAATSFTVSNIHVEDYEADLTFEDLIRTALASGDFHDVIVGGADDKAFAITWGPQTDLDTPASALAMALGSTKTQLIWKNGMVEVGRFNDPAPVRTIQDRIIESTEIDEAKRRVNLVSIDGNEHYWLEIDVDDMISRDTVVTAYHDLPELLTQAAVISRAQEEMRRAALGASPGGETPLYFDLWRMDAVTWIDNQGNTNVVRIEGFTIKINQSTTPYQRQTFDTSLFSEESSDGLMEDPVADL